jgi:hypothetical protein
MRGTQRLLNVPYLSGTEDLMVNYARNTKATQMFLTSERQRFNLKLCEELSGYSDVPYLPLRNRGFNGEL